MKLKFKVATAITASVLAGSAAYGAVSGPVFNLQQIAQNTWNRMSGATWYNPSTKLGTAKADRTYKYSSTDSTVILESSCNESGIKNKYGWDYAKMS
ncbi:MAG: hypothetical protein ACRESU_09255, partial [Gammaproteobacteria bacterium]